MMTPMTACTDQKMLLKMMKALMITPVMMTLMQGHGLEDVEHRSKVCFFSLNAVTLSICCLASKEPDLSRIEGSDLKQIILSGAGYLRSNHGKTIVGYLKDREIGVRKMKPKMDDTSMARNRGNIGSLFLPNKRRKLDQYAQKAFCGSYSKEGDFFMTSSQDHLIRMYDTSRDNFDLMKTFRSQQIGWSVPGY